MIRADVGTSSIINTQIPGRASRLCDEKGKRMALKTTHILTNYKEAQMANCIDLKKRFGDRYQIHQEESYQAERGNNGRVDDPWLWIIPCRHGHIYPDGNGLAASTNHPGRIANQLKKLPGTRVVQDADDGINVVFDLDYFDQVAAVMKPKRKKRLSPAQRAEQIERLRPYRFKPATHDAGGEHRRDPAA